MKNNRKNRKLVAIRLRNLEKEIDRELKHKRNLVAGKYLPYKVLGRYTKTLRKAVALNIKISWTN